MVCGDNVVTYSPLLAIALPGLYCIEVKKCRSLSTSYLSVSLTNFCGTPIVFGVMPSS